VTGGDSERPRQLFRDFGLTLALVLAAVLVWWRTTVPALQKNRVLDAKQSEMHEKADSLDRELERLRAAELAVDDPIEIERRQRAQHGELGLPPNEHAVRDAAPDDGPAAAGARRD